tara:strand:+ start:25092 stop:25703 length:612 start_codon:yes stop_codon:yes gene_type:complete
MSNKFVYIIGDSYFRNNDNNWLNRCFSNFDYDVVNLSKGGASFWNQFDHLERLSDDKNFHNIEYCVMGWSDPCRPYFKGDPMNNNNIDFEYRRAWAILLYVNEILYKKYSHIKFINYFCFPYLSQFKSTGDEYFIFDNQITLTPALYNLTYKKYGEQCQDIDNHFLDYQHERMSNILYNIIFHNVNRGIIDLQEVTKEYDHNA